ncbi:cellulase family glycosylhydrolase [Vibrio quintilis]|uniref:Endoglucanase Z n=1 Tax=Vibrio quintilis TaxID=1117707 RepID=A0A1M7YXR7_9VIBR|nr:cellulase family glycosylhydrolase [Vibrio quintilis]SHO57394.1 Endoglucanase Z precursor [Vibrio quintilis]
MPFIHSKKTTTHRHVRHSLRSKLLLSCACLGLGFAGSALASVEALSVQGNQIYAGGQAKSFSGNSLFWSNNKWGGEKFYTADVVKMLKDDWDSSIVRASMGIQEEGGYLDDPEGNKAKVERVVKAAIDNDMYVIIDWHSHHAEDNPNEAIAFFKEMATKYGDKPNVIYELYNEPLQISWSNVIKPYAESVISEIRKIDPDNLIVVGTPTWSQDVDVASQDPIDGTNIAYTLHFYAGTHGQYLRDKATTALNNGIALFVTEWGAVNADGDGDVAEQATNTWVSFMKQHNLSNANWALNDKKEGASTFLPDTMDLTASGKKVKEIIADWPYKVTTATDTPTDPTDPTDDPTDEPSDDTTNVCTGVNVYPNWTAKDWSGGEATHSAAGDKLVHENKLYTANWYTTSEPGTDASWTFVSNCE